MARQDRVCETGALAASVSGMTSRASFDCGVFASGFGCEDSSEVMMTGSCWLIVVKVRFSSSITGSVSGLLRRTPPLLMVSGFFHMTQCRDLLFF